MNGTLKKEIELWRRNTEKKKQVWVLQKKKSLEKKEIGKVKRIKKFFYPTHKKLLIGA